MIAEDSGPDAWVSNVEASSEAFTKRFGRTFALTDKNLAGIFEIGCFLAVISDYERQGLTAAPLNLSNDCFRYLTAPTGNPANFSYVRLDGFGGAWEIRQQVRICSHLHEDVNFTPDIVVIAEGAEIRGGLDEDYASGKKRFFRVNASAVVAAHECKSMTGYPELYVSFVGMFLIAHAWFGEPGAPDVSKGEQGHLAPSLFVGSEVSNLHRRMVVALEGQFPINLITGLHRGKWAIDKRADKVNRVPFSPASIAGVAALGSG